MGIFTKLILVVMAAVTGAHSESSSPLQVDLEMIGNTMVQATIKNTGLSDVKVLKDGSFLDERPTQKVRVHKDGNELTFLGVRLIIAHSLFTNSSFEVIPSGQAIQTTFAISDTHDLRAGGPYSVYVDTHLSWAKMDSLKVSGRFRLQSSPMTITVDGLEAARVHRAWRKTSPHRRTTLDENACTDSSDKDATETALSNCAQLAQAAQEAASGGQDKERFKTFWRRADRSTRRQVASVYANVVNECQGSSDATYDCDTNDKICKPTSSGTTVAFTVPADSVITNCPAFYRLPALTDSCHERDQACSVLHETTHLPQVAGTDDYAYEYDNIIQLPADEAVNNADTYAFYANAVYANCDEGGGGEPPAMLE